MTTLIERVRQPEYTGENRCVPCTLANSVIAVLVSAAVGYGWLLLVGPFAWAPALAVLAVSAVGIWLRGYLVPGTPTLTKRYFPDWLLRIFDKGPEEAGSGGFATDDRAQPGDAAEIEPERLLASAGVIEACPDVDDVCLDPAFRDRWEEAIAGVSGEAAQHEALVEALGMEGEVSFDDYGSALAASVDGQFVGQWESRAALVADLAAARALPEWVEGWEGFSPAEQGTLVRGLRIFVETCPTCGGAVVPAQETVQSCCREYEVMAVSCQDCGDRLFEAPASAAGAA
jgi:hypothetical protein